MTFPCSVYGSHFTDTMEKYLQFKCTFEHISDVAKQNKGHHRISELKLNLIDTFFLTFMKF